MRKSPDFAAWCARARPLFEAHVASIREAEYVAYGRLLDAWHEWLSERRLFRYGRQLWTPPEGGPLYFTPPSLLELAVRMAQGAGYRKRLNLPAPRRRKK